MKTKNLLATFLLSFCMIGFVACDTDNITLSGEEDDDKEWLIWDFSPIVLGVLVQDAQGVDLLNPDSEGSIAEQGIKAIYKGEVYEKDSVLSRTKAYMPYFAGLQVIKGYTNGRYYLTFGEFDGTHTFDKEEVVIDWNDGTKDTIHFSSKLTWKSKKEPVINRAFYLNGEELDSDECGCGGIFVVVK